MKDVEIRKIKVVYMALILFGLSVVLTGCRPAHYYNYDFLKQNVEKVEIIYIHDWLTPMDLEKDLNGEEINLMFLEISKIKFSYPFGDPPDINGYCIKMYYLNSEYEIIGQKGTKRFDKDGEVLSWYKRRCSEQDFINLLSKFIEIKD